MQDLTPQSRGMICAASEWQDLPATVASEAVGTFLDTAALRHQFGNGCAVTMPSWRQVFAIAESPNGYFLTRKPTRIRRQGTVDGAARIKPKRVGLGGSLC